MEIALTLNSLARRSAAKTAHPSTLNHFAASGGCREVISDRIYRIFFPILFILLILSGFLRVLASWR
jgi:hypothetical protein